MEDQGNQRELFEFEEPKKPFPKFANMLPKPDFEGRVAITLTLEKMVFVSIGVIMLMVIVFAIGVETGRSRASAQRASYARKASQAQAAGQRGQPSAIRPAIQSAAVPQQSFFSMAPAVQPAASALSKPVQPQPRGAATTDKSRPYTIIAATFSKAETAQAAAAFLQKEGYAASVTYTDPYYRVCVGAYADMRAAQAEKDLVKIRRIYKDAFIRLR